MNQREINSLNMIDGTLAYMNSHKAAWQNEAPIAESIDYITTRRAGIAKENKELAETQTEGFTAEMYAGLDKAVPLAYQAAKRMAVYARKKGDLVLLHDVDFAQSELSDGRFDRVLSRLELVHTRGQEHLAQLAPFKVKQADLDALKAATYAVKNLPATRKSTTGERVESTAAIKQLLREILQKLNSEMDDEVEALIEDEELVEGYFAVRRTDDRRGRGPAKEEAVIKG